MSETLKSGIDALHPSSFVAVRDFATHSLFVLIHWYIVTVATTRRRAIYAVVVIVVADVVIVVISSTAVFFTF